MGIRRRKMRTLLLNPRYQLKFVFLTVGSSLLLAGANVVVFYHYVQENYAILVDLSPMTDAAKGQLYQELHQIFMVLTTLSVCFGAAFGSLALWFSHRTAGPLYHFKRVFNEISDGKSDLRIHLRPGDEFQDVAKAFNEMMDKRTALHAAKVTALKNGTVVPLKDASLDRDRKAA
jgi:methyl-accepting chemotaxis protein